MGRKVDPRDFLLNTDYEMDKIVYFKEGSVTPEEWSLTIPHKLSFIPLIFGVCAFNSDFSDSRSIPYTKLTRSAVEQLTVIANATSVNIAYAGTTRMYYRLYAFEPTMSHSRIGATAKHAKQFILNTDYNYCKLYKSGVANVGDVINHNFGYIPQVLAWGEGHDMIDPSYIYIRPIEESAPIAHNIGSPSYVAVTKTQVQFRTAPGQYDKIHYRIYYDEV